LNLAITLADSFDQEINNFDGLYFGNFFREQMAESIPILMLSPMERDISNYKV
jgi:hypothetical protein